MPTLRLLPELEVAIRQIPGVRAASVVTDPQANPTEVHVLATPGKPAKQVVRDVQSLAMAQFDVDIDHRMVSVVQLEDESTDKPNPDGEQSATDPAVDQPAGNEPAGDEPAVPEPAVELENVEGSARPVITEIILRSTGSEAEAEVTLSFGGSDFTGMVTGGGAASQRPRLVAHATLTALSDLLGLPADVESASVVDTGANPVALVVLTVSIPRLGSQSLAGSAVVRGDEADAVARAVLSALNRRLTG
jgi:hypothetical protein